MLIYYLRRRTKESSHTRDIKMPNLRTNRKAPPREILKSEPPKRETTMLTGLPTPDQSFQVSSGTVTPVTPKEEALPDNKPIPNTIEGALSFSTFNHGLLVQAETVDLSMDDDYFAPDVKRHVRSQSRKSTNKSIITRSDAHFSRSFSQIVCPRSLSPTVASSATIRATFHCSSSLHGTIDGAIDGCTIYSQQYW